jgi:hypothetical protein
MSNRTLGVLAAVAAVMVLWAVLQARLSTGGRAKPSGPTYLIQGLEPAGIASITVGEGDDAVKIKRQGNQFVVESEGNYPADTKQINDLITQSLDIKTSDLYTDKAKNHADLEVTEDKARHIVKFFKADGSLLTGVVIGKSRETGQGSYVRLASKDEVYLADQVPYFRSRALDYVNQEIVAAKREDVNTVTVTTPEGAYTLRSEGDGDDVVMENVPAGKKLKASDAKSVLTALTSLRFDDVNKPAEVTGLTFDHEYVARLDNTTEYRLKLAKQGDKTYLLAEASYSDTTKVTINPNQPDSAEELKKKEAKLLAQEHVQKFMQRHQNWIYQIPDWKANYLMKKPSELLEDEEKPAEETADAPAPTVVPTVLPELAVEPNEPTTGNVQPVEMPEPEPQAAPEEPQEKPAEPNQPADPQPADPNAARADG